MYIGLVSDIHGNYAAWKAVQNCLQNVDYIYCLGDLIGYGPGGLDCICDVVSGKFDYWLPGNHEKGWLELHYLLKPASEVNGRYRFLREWTQIQTLWSDPSNRLEAATRVNQIGRAIAFHSGEREEDALLPLQYKYGISAREEAIVSWLHLELEALGRPEIEVFRKLVEQKEEMKTYSEQLDGLQIHISHGDHEYFWPWEDPEKIKDLVNEYPQDTCNVIVFGHSHMPVYSRIDHHNPTDTYTAASMAYGVWLPLGSRATIINPGSVGWPGDDDPRPAYAILDTTNRRVQYYRVEEGYESDETANLMTENGYPNKLLSEVLRGLCRIGQTDKNYHRAKEMMIARKSLFGGLCDQNEQ